MDKLRDLLEAHKLLVTGHPNLKSLRKAIEQMLADLDNSYAPKPAAAAAPVAELPTVAPTVATPYTPRAVPAAAVERKV